MRNYAWALEKRGLGLFAGMVRLCVRSVLVRLGIDARQ